jgi:hypothetical protein
MIIRSQASSCDEPDENGPAKKMRGGWRSRSLLLGTGLGLVATLVVVLVASILVSMVTRHRSPRLTRADFDAAVRRWEEHGPADYDLDLELSGNRPGKIHVEVRQRQVVHMTRDGIEPTQKRTWDYWSVPGQFDTLEDEMHMAENPAASFQARRASQMVMWAEFDPEWGFPRTYDRVVLGADYEVHWRITRFQAISAKK